MIVSELFDLDAYLRERRNRVQSALDELLPEESGPSSRVTEAMHYSLMAGGKRIRPILLMAGAEAVGFSSGCLLPAACALECIHTYSLIHDDLPAMDDDDLRRGKPACHAVFGEAVAILAGDGLLTYAFGLMSEPSLIENVSPEVLIKAISVLAEAAGIEGMVGGQTADVLMEGRPMDSDTLKFIHGRKTGALIRASVETGGLLGGGSREQISGLRRYGAALGLAFQVVDDLLDIEGDEDKIGKPVGSDQRRRKATYPSLFGLEETRRKIRQLLGQALSALEPFDEKADPLRAIAAYVATRDR